MTPETELVVSDVRPSVEDDERIAGIFRATYAPLCRLAFVMLGDAGAAEEVVMEAFVRTYASWRTIRDPLKAEAYVKRAVVNLSRNRIRRFSVERRFSALIHSSETHHAPGSDLRLGQEDEEMWKYVRALPARQRACVVLRYVDDLTEPDIAEILQCSIGNVKALLSRARAKLASSLDDRKDARDGRD